MTAPTAGPGPRHPEPHEPADTADAVLPVRLRPLARSDLARVMELEPQLFGRGAWSRGTYLEELATPGRTYVAADAGDVLVGYAGLAAGEEAQVMTVGVDARYRRRGIATLMLDALLAAAREQGAAGVLLEVRASDTGAQRLYSRAGFAPIGVRRNYYALEGEDAVVMRALLRPVPGRDGHGAGPVGGPGPVGAEAAR